MLNERDLLQAISECEKKVNNYEGCQKLATLYTIYDHIYGKPDYSPLETVKEVTIANHGDSEFLQLIEGKDAEYIWQLIDELLETVKATQPRLYDSVIRRLTD